jgi:acyl carrier protein
MFHNEITKNRVADSVMAGELALNSTAAPLVDLHHELKVLIVTECYKDVDPATITDEERLLHGRLELDSLDALEICHAIKAKYGVHISNGTMARRVMKNIGTLAAHVQTEMSRQRDKK